MKRYSLIIYKKEGEKQNLRCINFETYNQAKKELEKLWPDLKDYEEVEGSYLYYSSGNTIIKIC